MIVVAREGRGRDAGQGAKMSTPSNPFGSTSSPGEQPRHAPSRPGDTAGEATAGTDGPASRPGMADISEIQTDLLPERQWDKSDVLTDKLPPRPRDISEVETGRLPERSPDITELETGLLRPRPPVVGRPDTLPPAPVAVPVVVPAPVSVPAPIMPAPASEPDPVPVPVRLFAPTRPAVEISELPTGKLTMPPRPRPGLRPRPRPRPRPDTGDVDDQRERERERKRAELRERGRIRARAATETRELDDLDDSAEPAPLPTRRRRRRAWWIAGLAVVLALLTLSGGGLVTFSATQGPEAVIQAYCGDLLARDYASAYDLLSPHARARLTREQFERAGAVRERLDGAATACALADGLPLVGNVAALNPFATTATITATLRRRRAQTGAVTLVRQDGGAWAIDRIDPSLEGADVTPLLLADTFCGALVAGDFHAAYGLFSAAARHRVSEAEFTQAVKDALSDGGNAKLASCTPDPASYSVMDATASVTANVDTSAGGVPLTLPTTLTFVKAQGGWTIDNFDVTP
jgi:hypothetical protein